MDEQKIEYLGFEQLSFDVENPRMVEFHFTKDTPVETIINTLWDQMGVEELVMSILSYGFFQHEPMYAIHEEGKLVVVEGNRRLAAITAILNPDIIKNGKMGRFEGRITPEIKDQLLNRLPVLIIEDRQAAWRYIGYKHVNGAAKWGAYAKAHYIAHVHREYGISLDRIAEQIGDANNTVRKMYQGYLVLEQAVNQAGFAVEDTYTKRIFFSHLYTAIGYENYRTFLNLQPNFDAKNPIDAEHIENLKDLMLWLFGSLSQKIQPVITSQNPDLRKLNEILGSKEAVATLRISSQLETAYEICKGYSNVLYEALTKARIELEKASAKVGAYDGDRESLKLSGTIANIADSLYEQMEKVYQKKEGQAKQRITD